MLLRCFLLTILFLSSAALCQEVLRYDSSGSTQTIPYHTNEPGWPGIISESLNAILKEAGITPQPVTLPPRRTLFALEQGQLDFHVMSVAWFPNGDYGDNYVMSAPFIEVNEYVIALASEGRRWLGLKSLAGMEVGTIHGYSYHDMDKFTRVDFQSEKALLQALKLNRVDMAIIGELPAMHWSKQLDIPIVRIKLHSSGELHLRMRKEKEHLLPSINEAINRLKLRGDINAIETKYRERFNLPPKNADLAS